MLKSTSEWILKLKVRLEFYRQKANFLFFRSFSTVQQENIVLITMNHDRMRIYALVFQTFLNIDAECGTWFMQVPLQC